MNFLNLPEYDILISLDDADRTRVYENGKELFQKDGYQEVKRILEEKKQYLESLSKVDEDEISKCRVHDTIFISGDRGAGKTAFMLNIQDYITNNDSGGLAKTFVFLKPIDPTILEDHEHFLSIIIAQIVEGVEATYRSRNSDLRLENYYKALSDVSESMKAVKERKDEKGIEEIASSQSSLKLEKNAHLFFRSAAEMMGGTAIVVLIDDIDMAFEKGIKVLELVRKYLASPFVVPVVSGDTSLYKKIISGHFQQQLVQGRPEWLMKDDYVEVAQEIYDLSEQYLAKVFRNENRIRLKTIFEIIRENRVVISVSGKYISYNVFKEIEIRLMNLRINQKSFTQEVLTDNARLFIQYLAKKKIEIFEMAEKFSLHEDTNNLSHFPYMSGDRKLSAKIDQFILENYTNISKFNNLKSSFYKTAQLYQFNDSKIALYKTANNDYRSISDKGFSVIKALSSDFFSKEKNVKVYKPNQEYIVEDLYVSKTKYSKDIIGLNKDNSSFIFSLFVYDDYFSSYQTRYFLMCGRFFEIILSSLDPSFSPKELKRILVSPPFNANITKSRFISEDIPPDDAEIETRYLTISSEILRYWSGEIDVWRQNFFSDKLPHFLATHFLHTAANKFFNNINVLKVGKFEEGQNFNPGMTITKGNEILKGEQFVSFLQRTVAILLNSIASFESRAVVAHTNIGISKNFNYDRLKNSDNAYRKNIAPLLSDDKKLRQTYTNAFRQHPIIKAILGEETDAVKLMANIFIGRSSDVPTKPPKGPDKPELVENLTTANSNIYEGLTSNKLHQLTKDYNYKTDPGKLIIETVKILQQTPLKDRVKVLKQLESSDRKWQKAIDSILGNDNLRQLYSKEVDAFNKIKDDAAQHAAK